MFGPVTMRGAISLGSGVVALVLLVTPGLAQDGRAFWPQQRTVGTQPQVPAARSAEPLAEDTEKAAAQLYSDARDALDTGNHDLGQRRLERLVGLYPDTVMAGIARRDLKLLYARSATRPAQELPGLLSTAGAAPVQPSLTPPPPTQAPRVPVNPEAVSAANAELRMAAGDRLFFGDSSTEISSRAKGALEAMALWLRRNPGVDIVVEGHADDRGTLEFNRSMADLRAETVRARLIDLGVAPGRIGAVGLGRENPIADCREAQCAAQNRRAVVVVTNVTAPLVNLGPGLRPDFRPDGRTDRLNGRIEGPSGVTAVQR
jgi:peptidoglycan-associated lipoprotein